MGYLKFENGLDGLVYSHWRGFKQSEKKILLSLFLEKKGEKRRFLQEIVMS